MRARSEEPPRAGAPTPHAPTYAADAVSERVGSVSSVGVPRPPGESVHTALVDRTTHVMFGIHNEEEGRQMDLSKLSPGSKILAGGAIVFLIVSLFHWQEVSFGPISAGVNMWHGWGVLAGLAAIAVLAWSLAPLVSIDIPVGSLSPQAVTGGLAGVLVVSTVLKFFVDSDFRTVWAWIGLVVAIAMAVVAGREVSAARRSQGIA